MRKAWTAIAASALCALATATAAEAAGKQRIVVEDRSESYAFAIDCSPFGPYDFDILVSGREFIRVTEVLAADGSLLQTVVRYRFAEQASNSETGYTLPLKRSVREAWNWDEGTRTVTGTIFIGTQHGGGTYVQDTGLITLTLDTDEPVVVHGPHEAFFGDGIDAIQCAALASGS